MIHRISIAILLPCLWALTFRYLGRAEDKRLVLSVSALVMVRRAFLNRVLAVAFGGFHQQQGGAQGVLANSQTATGTESTFLWRLVLARSLR